MLVLLPNFKPAIENNINFKYYALSCNTHIQKKKNAETLILSSECFLKGKQFVNPPVSHKIQNIVSEKIRFKDTHTHTYMYKFSSEANG